MYLVRKTSPWGDRFHSFSNFPSHASPYTKPLVPFASKASKDSAKLQLPEDAAQIESQKYKNSGCSCLGFSWLDGKRLCNCMIVRRISWQFNMAHGRSTNSLMFKFWTFLWKDGNLPFRRRIHGNGIFTYIWLMFMANIGKHTSPILWVPILSESTMLTSETSCAKSAKWTWGWTGVATLSWRCSSWGASNPTETIVVWHVRFQTSR